MDNFIVSARKYRPQTFEMVVGQKTITTTLKNAIKNNQLAQAFLFCGPRGVGKTTCARILAKTINCQNITENFEACDQCVSCRSFNETASFNLHELDAASNNSVDDIRNLVDQVRIPPQAGKYKVYIIDEVHMLSQSAFNAFLKTLEEPPAYAKFILATTEKHKILPTILSRCQIFDFRRITIDDIAGHLKYVAQSEGVKADHDALHIISEKADGALRDALSIFDQISSCTEGNITYQAVIDNLNILDYDYYFKMSELLLKSKSHDVLLLINEVIDNGFDGLLFVNGFSSHLRNVLLCKDKATVALLEVGENIKERYLEQAEKIPSDFLLKALEIANRCDVSYKTATNKRLHLELAFMQMCSLIGVNTINTEVEKKKTDITDFQKPTEEKNIPVVNQPQNTSQPEKTPDPIPVIKPQNKTSFSKSDIISIKELTSEPEKKEEESVEIIIDYGNNEFSQENLIKTWNVFADNLKDTNPNYYCTLTKHTPILKENNIVVHTVDNTAQEDEFTIKKSELLGFLKQELKNSQITLEVILSENTTEDKIYSPVDKFQKISETNPNVTKLKNQLDLEIDY